MIPRRLVETFPCLVCFLKGVSLACEICTICRTAGGVGYTEFIGHVPIRHACVQKVDLTPSAGKPVVVQHGCYGAVEGYAIEAYWVDVHGLAGLELETSGFIIFGIAADCTGKSERCIGVCHTGKSARSIGVFHLVADCLVGEISDANVRCWGAK